MTNRWYLDTEFNEDGKMIELISIALISEDGREYYAVSSDFDPARCNEWVQKNVLPHLDGYPVTPRATIAKEILALVGEKPEFWAYFADYDWVALCQLYGRMIDLPKGWPMYCRDLKQRMDTLGVKREDYPPQLGASHSAIEDARWVRAVSLLLDGPPSLDKQTTLARESL